MVHFSPMHTPASPKLPISMCTSTGKSTKACCTWPCAPAGAAPSLCHFPTPMAELCLQPCWGAAGGGGQLQQSLAQGGEACGTLQPLSPASPQQGIPHPCNGLSCPACPSCYMLGWRWPCPVYKRPGRLCWGVLGW